MIEAKFDSVEYKQFCRYFFESVSNFNSLAGQARILLSEGKKVSSPLKNEIFRHQVIVSILTQACEERYKQKAQTVYERGYIFDAMGDDEIGDDELEKMMI